MSKQVTASLKRISYMRFLIIYTVAFTLLSLVVFSPFIIEQRLLIRLGDSLTQHIKALEYYGIWLQGIGSSLVSGQGWYMPTFSFSLGFGSDIIGTLNYYALGDPLNLTAAFVPREWIPTLYMVLIFVRIYLSGLTFALFCRYTLQPPHMGLLVGALSYAFCGFALYASVRHPYFDNALIYFPLVLYGVEKVLRERKHVAFALSIALSMVSNFYFFYMIFILMVLYIIMRFVALYLQGQRKDLKDIFAHFGHLVCAGLVGVLISGCIFLPIVLYFAQDTRSSIEQIVPWHYPLSYYAKLLLGTSSVSRVGYWTHIYTGIVGVISIFSLFLKRHQNTQLKIALVTTTIMLCIPFFGHMMNGFSYVSNRWCWAFCFAACCAIALRWQDLICMTKHRAIIMALISVLYITICMAFNWEQMIDGGYLIIMALWLLSTAGICFLATINGLKGTTKTMQLANIGVCVIAFAGITLNGLALYSPIGGNYASEFLYAKRSEAIHNTEAEAIAKLNHNRNDFYRYSTSRKHVTLNAGVLSGLSSTNNYWSLTNSNTKDFFHKMGINGSERKGYCWYDLCGQSSLIELVGVKYFAASENDLLPYGFNNSPLFTRNHIVPPENTTNAEYAVFENENPLPFGFTYESVMTPSTFNQLQPQQRREAILQTCLIDEKTENSKNVKENGVLETLKHQKTDDLTLSSQVIPFTMKAGKNAKANDHLFTATQNNAKITLTVDAPKNAEISLQVRNLTFATETSELNITTTFKYANKTHFTRTFSVARGNQDGMEAYTWYEPFEWLAISPGYTEVPLKSIVITLPQKGTYSFDDLQVIAQPQSSFNSNVSSLTEDVLENVQLHYLSEQSAATNHLSGTIKLMRPKVLCTQIPYSDGWKVFIDGKEEPLLRLNVMQSGVALSPGEHKVEFVYETPGVSAGLLITALGIVALILLVLFDQMHAKPASK